MSLLFKTGYEQDLQNRLCFLFSMTSNEGEWFKIKVSKHKALFIVVFVAKSFIMFKQTVLLLRNSNQVQHSHITHDVVTAVKKKLKCKRFQVLYMVHLNRALML